MFNNEFETKATASSAKASGESVQGGCRAFYKLNQWQVRQYRHAIHENKWFMGERLGRAVTWEEAEYDFLHNEYYGCAPKWRQEYCAVRCPHLTGCTLGKQFTED